MDVNALVPFIDNFGASVLFLVFLSLWHKRTMQRDKDNQDTIKSLMIALMQCVQHVVKEDQITPRD